MVEEINSWFSHITKEDLLWCYCAVSGKDTRQGWINSSPRTPELQGAQKRQTYCVSDQLC